MTNISEKNETNPQISREDAALYRLFALIGFAIVGFAGLVLIGNNEGKCWDTLSSLWFKIPMLLLFAASVVFAVLHYAGKIKLEAKVFSLGGICMFAAPIFALLGVYSDMTNANVKAKIALVAIVFLAFICNIYPAGYGFFSASMTACAIFMYYISKAPGNFNGKLFDKGLKVISYPMAFLVPLAIIAVLFIAKKNGGKFKLFNRTLFKLHDKSVFNSMLVILCASIALSALIIVFPGAFLPAIIALGVIYIAVGIICTIKIL